MCSTGHVITRRAFTNMLSSGHSGRTTPAQSHLARFASHATAVASLQADDYESDTLLQLRRWCEDVGNSIASGVTSL